MAIRVSEGDVQRIRDLGMARALRAAQEPGASVSFKEAVRRFYPKAQFGPKTKAAAEAADVVEKKTTEVTETAKKKAVETKQRTTDVTQEDRFQRGIGRKATPKSPPQAAIDRRLGAGSRIPPSKKPKPIGTRIMEHHRELDKKWTASTKKTKKSLGKFFSSVGEKVAGRS